MKQRFPQTQLCVPIAATRLPYPEIKHVLHASIMYTMMTVTAEAILVAGTTKIPMAQKRLALRGALSNNTTLTKQFLYAFLDITDQ